MDDHDGIHRDDDGDGGNDDYYVYDDIGYHCLQTSLSTLVRLRKMASPSLRRQRHHPVEKMDAWREDSILACMTD